jgi:hypothetical protein
MLQKLDWLLLVVCLLTHSATEALVRVPVMKFVQNRRNRYGPKPLRYIPVELEGQLDGSRKWDVKFIFNGEEKVMTVAEDMSLLEAGEELFYGVDSSCRNGVCTSCAAKVL